MSHRKKNSRSFPEKPQKTNGYGKKLVIIKEWFLKKAVGRSRGQIYRKLEQVYHLGERGGVLEDPNKDGRTRK